jgi:hypothetical protein
MRDKHLQTIAHGLILTSIMLGLIAAALWLKSGPLESSAQAALSPIAPAKSATSTREGGAPDAGKQRYEIIDQLVEINRHLVDIERGLRDGAYTVQANDVKGSARAAARDAGDGR